MGLEDLFPGSAHVFSLGLSTADDRAIWDLAKSEGFTIVSKDSDFASMSVLEGAPPKVIWVARGNCSTTEVEQIIRVAAEQVQAFSEHGEETYLVLT